MVEWSEDAHTRAELQCNSGAGAWATSLRWKNSDRAMDYKFEVEE